jgi:muramoyltetrapeptide carboxypeptidase LdcA involved in peptidoglycan recycling/RimJ/RimL family protein N-acetyltransferase
MKLRRTKIADLDFVHQAEHHEDNRRFITPWSRSQHEERLHDSNTFHAILTTDDGSRPVGFVFVNGLTSNDGVIELKRIVVTEKGRGFGREAVRAIKALAFDEWNATRLWLDVRDFNDVARGLYESEGFRLEGQGESNLLVYSIKKLRLQRPKKLNPGDRVAAVTPSWGGPGCFPHRYEAGKRQLMETFGVEVSETPHALRDPEWVKNHPRERAQDLMDAFKDPSIKGIIATIGGDDSVRLLPYLDVEVIRQNPKIFMGYSDTTISHIACLNAGLVSFYGPSFMAGFAENCGMHPYLVDSIRRTLFTSAPIGPISPNPEGWTVEFLDWADPSTQNVRRKLQPPAPWRWLQGAGTVRGHLVGGCSDVLEFIKGTPFWPRPDVWSGAILFLENSEEAASPETFRRWIRNYGTMGVFNQVSAIIFGRPGGSIDPARFGDYDKVLVDVVANEFGRPALPIVTQMDFGHTDPMFVIPYGVTAELNCEQKSFSIPENAVVD